MANDASVTMTATVLPDEIAKLSLVQSLSVQRMLMTSGLQTN